MRAETGPMRFGYDWPGLFIRGDESLHFGLLLKALLEEVESGGDALDTGRISHFDLKDLKGLADKLSSVDNQVCKESATALKAFEQCVDKP
jgi:hypothetical protein